MREATSIESQLFSHEVKSIDILCGRCKLTFNHTGNRRFRFIIALNLDRYRYAIDRRSKSKIVNSIVKQVQQLGGHFLERYDAQGGSWFPVSFEVARRKVSHALRDKYPFDSLQNTFGNLKTRIKICSVLYNINEDSLYDQMNLRVLQAILPCMDHASDAYVENLLTLEIKLFISSLGQADDESSTELKQLQAQHHSVSYSGYDTDGFLDFHNLALHFEQSCMTDTDWKAGNDPFEGLGCNEAATNSRKLKVLTVTDAHSTSYDDHEAFHPFTRQEELEIIDNSFHDVLVDTHGKVLPILKTVGDLPQGFTSNDCENLIASLDHLS